jgi:hypothetical protein
MSNQSTGLIDPATVINTNFKVGDFAIIAEGDTNLNNVGKVVRLVGILKSRSKPDNPVWGVESVEGLELVKPYKGYILSHKANIEEHRLIKANVEPVIEAVKREVLEAIVLVSNKALTLQQPQ